MKPSDETILTIVKHGKVMFLLLILAPIFGGQYLVGIPQFIRQQNHALLWGAVITNVLLLFLVACVIRVQNRKAKTVALSITAISYLLGVGLALYLTLQGEKVLN